MITDTWKNSPKVYIAGAQSRAKTLKGILKFLYPAMKVEGFLVDSLKENEAVIDGIPVWERKKGIPVDAFCPVFIATKGIYHNDIKEELEKIGFSHIYLITSEMDNFFRNAYVRKYYKENNKEFVRIEDFKGKTTNKDIDKGAVIYVAKSIYDKPLQSDYVVPSYEKCIQVGAALTEERLENIDCLDSAGDSISEKNRQYCELTALYWIWKNTKNKLTGLAHYRRHFVIPDNWADIMINNNIDVILPVPTYVAPNISDNYKERHEPEDWDYLMEYLSRYYKEDYALACRVFSSNLYSPCNMFIATREVLEEMCEFIFPIIDAVVEHGGQKEDVYMNRYPGFISERLITLFFEKNRERYKIVYADKTFLN